jgi:phosphatidylglycerol---prolipoprotein diacylglyceryl transferase
LSLLAIVWNANPEIFKIPYFDWPIRWYGLLFVGGLFMSQYVLIKMFEKESKSRVLVEDLTIYVVLGTIIGARLGHILFYDLKDYIEDPLEIFKVWHGGLASHGGAIGILIGTYLFCKKNKIDYLWLLDRLVVVVCITSATIRIGNLMNSEIIGKPTQLPWAFIFKKIDEVPRHPSQLYESIFCVTLFAVLLYIWKNYRNLVGRGFIFGLFLILMWGQRFIVEFTKEPQVDFESALPIDMGQILSIPFFIAGLYFIYRSTINKENDIGKVF